MDQQIDPMKTDINWEEFRERQREAATEAVKGALVLDEVARREQIEVADADVEAEIDAFRRAVRPNAGGGPGAAREGGRPVAPLCRPAA